MAGNHCNYCVSFGLLGEYDALPGMSQKVCTHKESVVDGGWGKPADIIFLGVAHAGAAIGLKKGYGGGKATRHSHLLWLPGRRGADWQSPYGPRPCVRRH